MAFCMQISIPLRLYVKAQHRLSTAYFTIKHERCVIIMANISTAEGDITLKGSVKSIKAFLTIVQSIEDLTYTLYIDDAAYYIEELDELTGETEETYPFFGTGRWTFEKTLESLFGWIDNEQRQEPKWTSVEESAWQQINQDPLHLTLTYVDYDNSEFLVKERTTIHWHKKQISNASVEATVLESYDMDAENYEAITAEEYYDYSTYTVKKMNAQGVNWIEQIQRTPLKDRINRDVFQAHIDAILTDLGRYLDDMKDDYGNALWVEIPEWFDDEEVQAGIEHVVGKYSTQ